ncbi:unnamed protein product [Closterium sp. NIES-65]|nr:unnamed protein product [Closterium sp. NIES-65]
MVDADSKSGESLSEVEGVASDSDDSWAATDLEEDNGDAVSEDVEEQDREFSRVKEVGALDVNGTSEDNERSFWEVQFENDEENEDCDDDPDRMKRWSKNATTRAGKKKRKEEEEEEEQELASLPSEEEEEEEEADEDEALSVRAKRAWRNMKRCSNGDGKKSQKQQKQQDKKRKRAAKAAAWVRPVHLEGEEVEEERMAEWERDLAACNRGEVTPQQLVEKRERPREQEPAPDILMPLLPFQKEWLAWSLKQEQGPIKGGILADEMGMGKTIQAISLIVTSRHLQSHAPAVTPVLPQPLPPSTAAAPADVAAQATAGGPGSSGGGASEAERRAVKATLVICPLIAVLQWRQEIARFTRPDSVKVLVYHGPKRAISVKDLEEYDVVLTTFSIVEAEMRAAVFPSKVPCQWCQKMFFPDRLEIHQKYFCGPNAKRTAKQAKQQKKLPRSFKGFVANPIMKHGYRGDGRRTVLRLKHRVQLGVSHWPPLYLLLLPPPASPQFVANPIMKHGYGGDGRRAMLLLKHRVLDRVLLRRTKTERAADLTLPPRTSTLRRDRFDAREEDFYEALYTQSQSQFATSVLTQPQPSLHDMLASSVLCVALSVSRRVSLPFHP